MKTLEQKIITSRGKYYKLFGRSPTLAAAKREAAALKDQGHPEAFARHGVNCGEIFVDSGEDYISCACDGCIDCGEERDRNDCPRPVKKEGDLCRQCGKH